MITTEVFKILKEPQLITSEGDARVYNKSRNIPLSHYNVIPVNSINNQILILTSLAIPVMLNHTFNPAGIPNALTPILLIPKSQKP
jgi:hypothetical protein